MAILKDLYERAAEKMADIFLGEPVREWGVIHVQPGRFFEEAISLDLYRKDNELVIWLKAIYKSSISYNTYGFAINVRDLRGFVDGLQSRYQELCRLARLPKLPMQRSRDRLPFVHRLIIKAIFGIRASRLLLDHRDPRSRKTDYSFYGVVTRGSEIRVFLQSDMDRANRNGTVISGEGFAAALGVLKDFLESEQGAAQLFVDVEAPQQRKRRD